jgi:hypothetical protein
MEWRGFDKVLPNSVYSLHDYTAMGFPKGELYEGTAEQKLKLERQFLRKAEFMHQHKIPIWNGEFGPVYADAALDEGADKINQVRYNVLAEQLRIYDKYKIHWSIWLYKDIGLQGMVHTSPSSVYMKIIAPFLARKRQLQIDAWGCRPALEVESVITPLVEWIDKIVPSSKEQYPTPWATERQISRLVLQIWIAGCLQEEFANLFAGMSIDELNTCARSFAFGECIQRDGLNRALEEHAKLREGA